MALGAWSIGGGLSTGRLRFGGFGGQASGVAAGGETSPGNRISSTEEYDGLSWASGGAITTATKDHAAAGSGSAGLIFGGNTGSRVTTTEEYNGTSWSSGGALGTAVSNHAGCGTQAAALSFGGSDGTTTDATEEYNGTSWSSGGALSTARSDPAGCGTQAAGLSFGGSTGTYSSVTEEYNGTSWSSGGALGTAVKDLTGFGTLDAAVSAGGDDGSATDVTEEYNGTSWSTSGLGPVARQHLEGAGTQSSGLAFGGATTTNGSTRTSEYNLFTSGSFAFSHCENNAESGTTSTAVNFDHCEDGDTALCFISKDDDVATTGPAGFTLVQGFESNNAIYTEIWKRDCDGTEGDYTWTHDSEEVVAVGLAIEGGVYSSLAVATSNTGTDAAPVSNALTTSVANTLVFAGFGVDGDSTPFTPDSGLIELSVLQSTAGADAAGQYIGHELFVGTGSTGTFDHTINSADEWTGFAVMIEPSVSGPFTYNVSITEAATSSESQSKNLSAQVDITEAETASEINAANNTTASDITETGTVADSEISLVSTEAFIPEAVTANDISVSNYIAANEITETVTAIDGYTVKADILAVLTEVLTVTASQTGEIATSTIEAAIAEVVTGAESQAVTTIGLVTAAETATATQQAVAENGNFAATIELLTLVDTVQAVLTLQGQVTETTAAIEVLSATVQYIATVAETTTAIDLQIGGTVETVQITEALTAVDLVTAVIAALNQPGYSDITLSGQGGSMTITGSKQTMTVK